MLPLIRNCRNDKVVRYCNSFAFAIILLKAANFLSCLATDIKVGLDSWVKVETESQKEVNSEMVALNDQLEVLK